MDNFVKNQTTDWAKIRAEYVNGNLSLSELSKKYDVKLSSIKLHSSKEKWVQERKKKQQRKADIIAEKVHEKDINKTVKDIERCCAAAGKLIDKINIAINQIDINSYISLDNKKIKTKNSKGQDGEEILEIIKTRNMKTQKIKTVADTKKIADLSKSLLNLKQVLLGFDKQDETEGVGIIEIPAMQELMPPEDDENE